MAFLMTRRAVLAVLVLATLILAPIRAGADGVLVFAAASLKTALDELASAYSTQTGVNITVSYAASSVLARQIQAGAPANIFISANSDWMDFLQDQGLIDPASRVGLLSNGLVLIGASDQAPVEHISSDYDIETELAGGYLAMALVDVVPAGIYGKSALENLGLWSAVRGQVAQTDNVRAALALVATGAAPLGVVYRSDAIADRRVSVVSKIPAETHPPIVYPAALMRVPTPEAASFLEFLQTNDAMSVFLKQGFSLPGR
ncbi:molybdate ABC transporter substrate-binding protein [Ruegeria sp. SCPT10]|uniref:molybdate ABC transporter substrate-binding protein n=1 Tax=Ruegeria sp. SCP10 TaxID=3141377 RepID=UPI003338834C